MTQIISCSISEKEHEFIKSQALSPSKLLQSAISCAMADEGGDIKMLLKGKQEKIERLSSIIDSLNQKIWDLEEQADKNCEVVK